MSLRIDADYTQQFLFPRSLEEWVPEEHPVRFLRDFVEALDLDALGFRSPTGSVGRPHYAPGLLLKVWLWGYMQRLRSSRQLEAACHNQVALLWLTGLNTPDHNTLWRFWRAHGEAIGNLFAQSVRVAVQANAVGLVLHAVDGTKIAAWASRKRAWNKADLERLLGALEKEVRELEEELAHEESSSEAYCLPEALRDKQARQCAIREALKTLEESGRERLHPEDPAAALMKTPRGFQWAYNAQAMVDAHSGLIVAQDVTNAPNDSAQLMPMLEKSRENTGAAAQLTLADGGYNAGAQLKAAHDAGMEVLAAPGGTGETKGNPYHASSFHYDAAHDCFYCPQGRALPFAHESYSKSHGCTLARYRCTQGATCPARPQCTKSLKPRVIERPPWDEATRRNRARARSPEGKALLKRRGAIVEHIFGCIKQHQHFTRFSFRGLDKVKAQWAMLCTAFNLAKLFKKWCSGQPPSARCHMLRTA